MKYRIEKISLICFLLFAVALFPLWGQEIEQQAETAQETTPTPVRTPTRVVVDEEIFEDEIVERVPESTIQPRTRTDEINFTLNYLRQLLMQSNKHLY